MGGFIPDFENCTNDGLAEKKTLFIQRRRIEEKADGTKKSFERTLDFAETRQSDGGKWLISAKPNFFDKDKDFMHRKKKEKSLTVTERSITEDAQGNKSITEDAYKMEDFEVIKGTKLIGNRPEISFDNRPELIAPFQKSPDIFGLLGSKDKISSLPKGKNL